ncbi:glucose 1-dehydrogenase [Paroceanicella profunda]|uniref:Glucose 1-dehydrogenase n=2 Tax=Paroceanicella profunda TaxID=2579971 RepID=A0A5B8G0H8_9RHOB|nr:glucose 1-dehydrogenase [Paroceanicella profunda]
MVSTPDGTGRFAGQVVAITGAGGALARATAVRLAAEGAKLALFDRDTEKLAETAALCPGALTVPGDVTSAADMAAFAEATQAAFGPAHKLVAAAGILGKAGPAIEMEEEMWDRVFAINVKGAWLAARAFIPQIRTHGAGAVVLFSSTAGVMGSPTLSAYSASKGAVSLLTRSLALNHAAENIRVNCVCPGTIDSPMSDSSFDMAGTGAARDAREAMMLAKIPMGRFGLPAEVADAVLYLLSDSAAYTSGVALPVDGARLA